MLALLALLLCLVWPSKEDWALARSDYWTVVREGNGLRTLIAWLITRIRPGRSS
jgi:hypothetical protein